MATENKYEGGCLCKSVRVVLHGDPKNVFICHCTDCQRSAGGAFQTSALYETDKIEVIDPDNKLRKFVIPGATLPSGFDKHKFFCGDCGAPLFNRSLRGEGKITVIKNAMLDKLKEGDGSPLDAFPIDGECFIKDRASFLAPIEGVPQFRTGYTL